MEPITLEQAKKLTPGMTIFSRSDKNANGSPQRWKVSGKAQTWKKDPKRVSVPLKRGMYSYSHLTENNLWYFSLTDY